MPDSYTEERDDEGNIVMQDGRAVSRAESDAIRARRTEYELGLTELEPGLFPGGPPTLVAVAYLAPHQKAHLRHIINELEQAEPVVRRLAARWLATRMPNDAP